MTTSSRGDGPVGSRGRGCPHRALPSFSCLTGDALRCYNCIGSNEEECNRQGARPCPTFSDACATVQGHNGSVMKTCSYKSFCNQAANHGYKAPGVKVHCCYSDECNVVGGVSTLMHGAGYMLIFLPMLSFLLYV